MPKLKSVIAGLAVSTALTGGVVAAGAATSPAGAAVQVKSAAPVLAGNCRGAGWRRCGWGGRWGGGRWAWGGPRWGWGGPRWGWGGHNRGARVRIVIVNQNHNINRVDRGDRGEW
ncbi:hypothetical protein AB0K16_29755 [Nonomuraea jabiensis]|uniref:Uncharacterized protein n=1 Tax=Nonomuraea jabiensis TaxID=882448 RepID=A0A7W9FZV8_9ACTN|nr:hypothetical protein [Nonomuraea jabiensis]MBB5774603.1 hypothetical protein [Nonomuraea jabiensis]